MDGTVNFLDGQLLVAMPGMGDPRFEKAVIFMCAHSSDGAMGLMINKPAPDLRFSDLLAQLDISKSAETPEREIYFGGPVEHGRGFVLHSRDYALEGSTMLVDDQYGMTATVEILRDMSRGAGPDQSLMTLGYAGWAPGQLEDEIQRNGWLTCEAPQSLVFDIKAPRKWEAALASAGIDPRLLSSEGGRA
ncbi:MAG: YqgE/AlgH family protein [Pseudomonadota bacterium]